MKIRSIYDVKNGDMVVLRDGNAFIRIDDYLIDRKNRWISCKDYETPRGLNPSFNDVIIAWEYVCPESDIIQVWRPRIENYSLSFDYEKRKQVFGIQKNKNTTETTKIIEELELKIKELKNIL